MSWCWLFTQCSYAFQSLCRQLCTHSSPSTVRSCSLFTRTHLSLSNSMRDTSGYLMITVRCNRTITSMYRSCHATQQLFCSLRPNTHSTQKNCHTAHTQRYTHTCFYTALSTLIFYRVVFTAFEHTLTCCTLSSTCSHTVVWDKGLSIHTEQYTFSTFTRVFFLDTVGG